MARSSQAEEEKDYSLYLDKEATILHKEFAAWICEKTGYDPAVVKSKQQVFLDAIRLGATLRMAHQGSPENQESIARRHKAAEDKAMAAAAEKPAPRAKKVAPASAVKAESDTGEAPEPVVKPNRRPAKATAPAATKPAAEERPPARRRPAKAASGTADAPF
jgi:hypothetical protein